MNLAENIQVTSLIDLQERLDLMGAMSTIHPADEISTFLYPSEDMDFIKEYKAQFDLIFFTPYGLTYTFDEDDHLLNVLLNIAQRLPNYYSPEMFQRAAHTVLHHHDPTIDYLTMRRKT